METTELGPADASDLLALCRSYDWWADREVEGVRRALAATDEAVGVCEDDTDELVAAARVLTDYTYYAMVFDVIVRADRRREGVGEKLLAALAAHPPLSGSISPFWPGRGWSTSASPVASRRREPSTTPTATPGRSDFCTPASSLARVSGARTRRAGRGRCPNRRPPVGRRPGAPRKSAR